MDKFAAVMSAGPGPLFGPIVGDDNDNDETNNDEAIGGAGGARVGDGVDDDDMGRARITLLELNDIMDPRNSVEVNQLLVLRYIQRDLAGSDNCGRSYMHVLRQIDALGFGFDKERLTDALRLGFVAGVFTGKIKNYGPKDRPLLEGIHEAAGRETRRILDHDENEPADLSALRSTLELLESMDEVRTWEFIYKGIDTVLDGRVVSNDPSVKFLAQGMYVPVQPNTPLPRVTNLFILNRRVAEYVRLAENNAPFYFYERCKIKDMNDAIKNSRGIRETKNE